MKDRPQVLFVDDEPRILDGLRRMLRPLRSEWEMTFVNSAKDALDHMGSNSVDVIVTDIRMPVMNGVELLKEIRARFPHVSRIVLSGQAGEDDGIDAIGPVHQFLSKPCDAETIRGTLERTRCFNRLLKDSTLRAMIARVESLPSPPDVHQELMDQLDRPNASIRAIGEIVSRDVGLTSKLLQLVNSSFFGISKRVVSPVQAVSMLGTGTVRAVAISTHLFSHSGSTSGPLSVKQFMSSSLEAAALSRNIARTLTTDDVAIDEAFLAGLLHDIGRLVLASESPEQFLAVAETCRTTGVSSLEAEEQIVGATHADIGGYLLGLWGFDATLVDAVVFHHAPARSTADSNPALTAVHIAEAILPLIRGHESDTPLDVAYLESRGLPTEAEHWIERQPGRREAA